MRHAAGGESHNIPDPAAAIHDAARLRYTSRIASHPAPPWTPPTDNPPGMTPITPDTLTPCTRVRITKQVAREGKIPSTAVEGAVVAFDQRKTGSWFAHGKDDKLWLDRLEITKADGEVYVCNVDSQTHIEILPPAGAAGVSPGDACKAGA